MSLGTEAVRRRARAPAFWERAARSAFFAKLEGLRHGRFTVTDADGAHAFGKGVPDDPSAGLVIHDPAVYFRALLGGSLAIGETYVDGLWDADDLTAVMRLFAANRDVLNGVDGGWGALLQPLERLLHWRRRNTPAGARENISAHYDLGDDFFALFLDDTWTYSAAVFLGDASLAEAQAEKNDRICRKLRLLPTDHVLEIGAGWGGFALHAARHYGCRVTATTISGNQFRRARARAAAAGLEGRVTVLFEDYRDLKGAFDKIVSVEMIEAVGLKNLGAYFEACSRLLKPDGAFALQAITIRDQYFDRAARSVDFIQRHVFPGSGIPGHHAMLTAVKERTDLALVHLEDFGPHYARTLREWSRRLAARRGVAGRECPERLHRLWQFYFSYCEGGFLERCIGVSQMLFAKPGNRMEPVL